VHRGLAPDLVWLVAELALSPFVHALACSLFAHPAPPLAEALDHWQFGYCPVCGSWPALAEVIDRRSVLRCSFCAAGWDHPGDRCIHCGHGGDRFELLTPSADRPDRAVEVCGACSGYLKVTRVRELSPFPLVAVGDLETMELDLTAIEKGYKRPDLPTFGHQTPSSSR
jgi:FdhE protein